jgi:hypothetical protein
MSPSWPQAYLIGAPKGGTTSLHTFFRRHRSFFTAEEKYTRYFARELHSAFCWGASETDHQALYLRAFDEARPDQITIDCENMTILNSKAAARISAVRPDARILVVLREPISRAWSHYFSDRERGSELRSPEDALLGSPQAFPGMEVPELYLDSGFYHRLLTPFFQSFASAQILLIDYEAMHSNAAGVQNQICNFFGVPDDSNVHLGEIWENVTVPARNEVTRSVLRLRFSRVGKMFRRAWQWLPAELRAKMKESAFTPNKRFTMPAALREKLIEIYKPDSQQLEADYGFDISSWRATWAQSEAAPRVNLTHPNWRTHSRLADSVARMIMRLATLVDHRRFNKASAQESCLIAKLRAEFASIDLEMKGASRSEETWFENMRQLRQEVSTQDPRGFLRWDVVRITMFFEHPPSIAHELAFLRHDDQWAIRWAPAIKESGVGRPLRYPFYPNSSGNLIHHAYHLARFEKSMGLRVDNYDYVVEFGGGYGSLCRLFSNLGFRGRYIIYDLPCFVALQRYFLRSVGIEVAEVVGSVREGQSASTASVGDLRETLGRLKELKGLFIATWSISEAPLELRAKVLPVVENLSAWLVAYQDQFQEVDNNHFFETWIDSNRNGMEWKSEPIEHMNGSNYLFGRSHI